MKVAVVTPYYKEPAWKLRRCHDSVLGQSDHCTHFLVADGFPCEEVSTWDCMHIVLPVSHQDNGNTPRSIGSLCAMNESYDAVCFLDADNWLNPQHVTSVLYAQSESQADVVFSGRYIVLPDGLVLDAEDEEDINRVHVDTSCMTFFEGAFRSLPAWCQMPQELSPVCDRVMYELLKSEFTCTWSGYRSVYFESLYDKHYLMAGRPVPSDAKTVVPLDRDTILQVNSKYPLRSYRPLRFD